MTTARPSHRSARTEHLRARPRRAALALLFAAPLGLLGASCFCPRDSAARCVDLDDQTPGELAVGDVVTHRFVDLEIELNGSVAGTAALEAGGLAGGGGLELRLDGATVQPILPYPLQQVSVRFHAGDGAQTVEVNGDAQTVTALRELRDFAAANGSVVSVRVVERDGASAGESTGTLTLSGEITDLRVGGDRLWLDDLCYQRSTGPLPSLGGSPCHG